MVKTGVVDPWEKICAKINFKTELNLFVSPPIRSKTIRKFGSTNKLIPIYSREERNRKYPFLAAFDLTPLRTGRGEAVLTKANLFQDIPPVITDELISISIPESLSVNASNFLDLVPNTETKYLVLAYNAGVFNKSLGSDSKSEMRLGVFGKFNLNRSVIELADTVNSRVFVVDLSNVQFELDFSLENEDSVFVFEAKSGRSTSFSVLQLFYPNVLMQEYASKTGKTIRNIFVDIRRIRAHGIKYRMIEFGFANEKVPNSIEFKREWVVDLEFGSQHKLF